MKILSLNISDYQYSYVNTIKWSVQEVIKNKNIKKKTLFLKFFEFEKKTTETFLSFLLNLNYVTKRLFNKIEHKISA